MAKMNKKIIIGTGLFFCLALFAGAESTEIGNRALQLVSKRMKDVTWDKKTIVEIDINCDGKKDYALLGKAIRGVTVAVIVGPVSTKSRIESFEFFVGKHSQDSLCELPAKLRIESLDYDPTEAVGKLPGFRSSKKCNAFGLTDDICDSFHFYWNHEANTLAWWRL